MHTGKITAGRRVLVPNVGEDKQQLEVGMATAMSFCIIKINHQLQANYFTRGELSTNQWPLSLHQWGLVSSSYWPGFSSILVRLIDFDQ